VRWQKRGLVFRADGRFEWMAHHACVPVPDRVNEDVLRIYFGPRDAHGRTVTAFIEVDADDPSRVLYVHDRPALGLGALGAFDDSGAMPSAIVNHGGRKYLYYIGWNRGTTVPYRNAVGLAVSDDDGRSFQRMFEGPVVDRTRSEPYFCASPFVLYDSEELTWKLWYASSTGWTLVHERPEPLYQVMYAESANGYDWVREPKVCLPYTFPGEANARPWVLKERGLYRMWYCFRGSVDYRTDRSQSYRLGYAESSDGRNWTRKDELVGIERSEAGWDSMMIEYPAVYEHRGRKHLLYNGNGFGETGIGHAVLDED
jgi:hypothetical protein